MIQLPPIVRLVPSSKSRDGKCCSCGGNAEHVHPPRETGDAESELVQLRTRVRELEAALRMIRAAIGLKMQSGTHDLTIVQAVLERMLGPRVVEPS